MCAKNENGYKKTKSWFPADLEILENLEKHEICLQAWRYPGIILIS